MTLISTDRKAKEKVALEAAFSATGFPGKIVSVFLDRKVYHVEEAGTGRVIAKPYMVDIFRGKVKVTTRVSWLDQTGKRIQRKGSAAL